MKIGEAFPRPHTAPPAFAVRTVNEEDFRPVTDEIVATTLRDTLTGQTQQQTLLTGGSRG